MPDFVLFAKAILVSAVAAGLIVRVAAGPTKTAAAWRMSVGSILGIAAGIYAGCGVLGEWPRWPAPEDRDRFLVILLPLALAVETAAGCAEPRWAARLLRLSLAAAAAPILLYNSTYLANLSGPNSAEWSPVQAILIFLILAAVLAITWGLLALLQARTSSRAVPSALMLVTLAAGITVMLSGYYRGGLLALPMAGAIAGALFSSRGAGRRSIAQHCLGIGMIGTFTVLLIGRFYGGAADKYGAGPNAGSAAGVDRRDSGPAKNKSSCPSCHAASLRRDPLDQHRDVGSDQIHAGLQFAVEAERTTASGPLTSLHSSGPLSSCSVEVTPHAPGPRPSHGDLCRLYRLGMIF